MAIMQVEIKGLDVVLKNLNKEIEGIKNRTRVGMIKVAVLIRGDAQKLCPMDTGNLVNSAYTVVTGGSIKGGSPKFKSEVKRGEKVIRHIDVGRLQRDHAQSIDQGKSETDDKDNPSAVIGFSAYYAAYVHEMEFRHDVMYGKEGSIFSQFKRPLAQRKFLETAIKQNAKNILEIIRKEASVEK